MDTDILNRAAKLNDYKLKLFLKNDLNEHLANLDRDATAKVWRALAKSSIDQRDSYLAQLCFKKFGLISPNFSIGDSQFTGHISYDRRLILSRLAFNLQWPTQIDDLAYEISELTKSQSSIVEGQDIDLLLNNLMQQNSWYEALSLAEKKGIENKIQTVHYNYALYLEDEQHFEKAIAHYERSGCIVSKITSIIVKITEDHRQLEQYCTNSPNTVENDRRKELINWYACFLRNHVEESDKTEYAAKITKLFLDIGHPSQAIDLYCSLNKINEAISLINTENANDEIVNCIKENPLAKGTYNNLNIKQQKIASTPLGKELLKRFAYHYEQHSPIVSMKLYLLVDAIYPAIVCSINGSHCNRLNCLQIALRSTTYTSVIYHTLISYFNYLKGIDVSRKKPTVSANLLFETNQEGYAIISRAYLKLGLLDEAIQYCCTDNLNSLSALLSDLEIGKASYQPGFSLILSESTIKTLISTVSKEPSRIEIITQLLIRSLQSTILYRYHIGDGDLLIKTHVEFIQRAISEYDFSIKDSIVDDLCSIDTKTAMSTSLYQLTEDNSSLSYDEDILSRRINEFRDVVLKELASKSSIQGQYKQAARLYSKLGDRLNAVKVLMRTNEVDIVVSYALVAKDKAVYQLTANYLKYLKADSKLIKLMQDKLM